MTEAFTETTVLRSKVKRLDHRWSSVKHDRTKAPLEISRAGALKYASGHPKQGDPTKDRENALMETLELLALFDSSSFDISVYNLFI